MTVFRYDLVRTTRRGRAAVLRAAYGLALLVALGGVFARWFPGSLDPHRLFVTNEVPARQVARFAEFFVRRFLEIQYFAALFLAAVSAAGAVAEERQRGTLDSLLVTGLSGADLVLGKFAARWLSAAGLLLTGAPILAMTLLWGGVDWRILAFESGQTLVTTLSMAGLGVLFSTLVRSVRRAVVLTLLVGGGLTLFTSLICLTQFYLSWQKPPFVFPDIWAPPLALYGLCQVVICLISLIMAAWLIRPQPLSPTERDLLRRAYDTLPAGSSVRVALVPHLLVGAPPPWSPAARPPAKRTRILPVPPIGDDPLLWKELHFGGSAAAGELVRVIAYGLIGGGLTVGLTFLLTSLFGLPRWVREEGGHGSRGLTLALLTVAAVGTALRAAATVGRERERQTLDSLRVLPAGPDAVLWAKWLGGVLRMRWLAAAAAGVLLIGVLAGGVHPASVVWLAVAAAVHGGFLASLGLFVSVSTAGTGRAAVATMVGLIATWVGPPVLFGYWLGFAGKSGPAGPAWFAALWQDGLSPPLTWRFLAFGYESKVDDDRFVGVMLGLAVYAAAAWVLWRLAAWRFRRGA